jgi:CheY-like chemotaxis protein
MIKKSQAPPDSAPPVRVLVAEDDAKTRQALAFLLQRHGYEVLAVGDGQAALEALTGAHSPGIALLDWEMPRLDGLHVAQAIRSLRGPRYCYLIMVTAHERPPDMLRAFASGVDDYLSKPVEAPHLLARIRSGERVLALEEKLSARVAELEAALSQVHELRRLMPICMYCKKVRDDHDYWQEIDAYLRDHAGADFSHCACPACLAKAERDLLAEPAGRLAESR